MDDRYDIDFELAPAYVHEHGGDQPPELVLISIYDQPDCANVHDTYTGDNCTFDLSAEPGRFANCDTSDYETDIGDSYDSEGDESAMREYLESSLHEYAALARERDMQAWVAWVGDRKVWKVFTRDFANTFSFVVGGEDEPDGKYGVYESSAKVLAAHKCGPDFEWVGDVMTKEDYDASRQDHKARAI